MLAVLHFNENSCRPQATDQQGKAKYKISFPKARKGNPVVKSVTAPITFHYVDELMTTVLDMRDNLSSYSKALQATKCDRLTEPLPIAATYAHPDKNEAVLQHKTRFNLTSKQYNEI